MTFINLWEIIVQQNPSLSGEEIRMIKISSIEFKRAIQLAYNEGRKEAKEEEKSLKDSLGYGGNNLFSDVFGNSFGKK